MNPIPAREDFVYEVDEQRLAAVASVSGNTIEWARKILTEMADMDFIYLQEQEDYQHFLLHATIRTLAEYVNNSTDAYYRAIER